MAYTVSEDTARIMKLAQQRQKEFFRRWPLTPDEVEQISISLEYPRSTIARWLNGTIRTNVVFVDAACTLIEDRKPGLLHDHQGYVKAKNDLVAVATTRMRSDGNRGHNPPKPEPKSQPQPQLDLEADEIPDAEVTINAEVVLAVFRKLLRQGAFSSEQRAGLIMELMH